MVHSNTELLIDYWRRQRAERAAPLRSDIDPADFPRLLPHVFIAERRPGGDLRFRLAGEALAELHGGPLGGANLVALWRHDHRHHLTAALEAALHDVRPLVIIAAAQNLDAKGLAGRGLPPGAPGVATEARLELLFAPLAGPAGDVDRFLGLYQSLSGRIVTPLKPLSIVSLAGARLTAPVGPRLAAVDGRRIA